MRRCGLLALSGSSFQCTQVSLLPGPAGLASGAGVLVFNRALLHNEAGNWRATTLQGLQMQMPAVQVHYVAHHIMGGVGLHPICSEKINRSMEWGSP